MMNEINDMKISFKNKTFLLASHCERFECKIHSLLLRFGKCLIRQVRGIGETCQILKKLSQFFAFHASWAILTVATSL